MSPASSVTSSTVRSARTVTLWELVTVSPPMPVRETGSLARRSMSAAVRASVVSKPVPNRI